ncbi:hypothetical protein BgiBS90_002831 [Biomphalaria glabrata]|nr:hypothetical protein BgiBS90_002831 [Biomphalaria glabrata]
MAMQKKVLGTKFNLCAKLIILCRRLCSQSQNNLAKSRHQYESVLQVIDDYETKLNWDGLTFTPDYFKAKKKDCLGLAAKSILRQAPGLRKKEEIEKLLIALRNIPAFAEYPIKMQNDVCKVGLYLEYEEKRVIIGECHRAHYFYIILSGTVVVTVFDESTGSSSTLVTLERGMSFGELELITHSKRQASVVCKTDVEVLSITYSEYQEIFMSGGIVKLDNDEHFEFLRSLQFLRHWPVEKLKENPTASCIYYFHRNTVLVRDSNNSDWIYVVLKGSLSVLKKLKNFTNKSEKDQRTPRTKGDQDVQIDEKLTAKYTENSFAKRKRRPGQWKLQSLDLPVVPEEQFKSSVELESKLSQTLPGYVNYKDRLLSLDYEKIIKSYQSRLLTKGTQQANFWKQDSAKKWLKQKVTLTLSSV